MTNRELLDTQGISRHHPLGCCDIGSLRLQLPEDHLALLRESNGLGAGRGYIRLFGIGEAALRDQIRWNSSECWKFAWRDKCKPFWCFAETARGCQFAYEIAPAGQLGKEVVYLDALTCTPRWTLRDFGEFVQNILIKYADQPLDPEFASVLAKLGQVPEDRTVVSVPHPSLAAGGSHEEPVLLPARVAMILNADMYHETKRVRQITANSRMETYIDDRGRPRFQLRNGGREEGPGIEPRDMP